MCRTFSSTVNRAQYSFTLAVVGYMCAQLARGRLTDSQLAPLTTTEQTRQFGFSVFPKDTITDGDAMGFEPPPFLSLDKLLQPILLNQQGQRAGLKK